MIPSRRLALPFAFFTGILVLSSTGPLLRGQDKAGWTEIYQDFRNSAPLIDFLNLVGPHHKETAKPGPEGLRITLPADRPVNQPVIVTTNFDIAGDFELTATYEWLSVAKPKKGYGAGVALTIQSNGARNQFAKVSRLMRHEKGSVYMIESWDHDKKKPDDYMARMFDTKATTGQLRLVRTGDVIRYLVADPPTNVFRELHRHQFPAIPLEAAHLAVTDSGEPGNEVDVRLIDWKIRMSKANPDIAVAPKPAPKTGDGTPSTPPSPTGAPSGSPDEAPRGVPRLVWILVAVLVLAALAAGSWFVLRSRRAPPPAPSKPSEAIVAATDAPIAFACAACKKQLKVKRTSAGKSVKCPQCGHANRVPL